VLECGWLRMGLLLAAAGLVVAPALPAQRSAAPAHGRTLTAQYRLPLEAIERYAALAAGKAPAESRDDDSRFADTLPWVGPEQLVGRGRNPYTLVLTVNGEAKAAGEVFAQWQTGWEIRETQGDKREVLLEIAGLATQASAARQAVSLTASSGPLSFRGERTALPKLGLVHMRNLDIHDVQLQVWSGIAPLTWPTLPAPSLALLALGLACLLISVASRHWPRLVYERVAVEPGALPGHDLEAAFPPGAGVSSAEAVPALPDPPQPAADVSAPAPAPAQAQEPKPDHRALVLDTLDQVLMRLRVRTPR
jgi:hypothetical protein